MDNLSSALHNTPDGNSPIVAMIRHGDYQQLPKVPSALQPFPLTPEGVQGIVIEAQRFAEHLDANNWRLSPIVQSSNQLRAWQTAQLYMEQLAEYFIAPPVHSCHDELSERAVGCLANLTTTEIEAILQADPRFDAPPADWKSNSYYRLPFQGAESLLMAGERVSQHIKVSLDNNTDSSTSVVQLYFGHGASFRHAAYHLGIIAMDDIKKLSMYHGKPVLIQKNTQNHWKHIAGQWKIRGQQTSFTD